MISVGSPQGGSCPNGQIPCTEVNYEPPVWTPLVLSVKSLNGRSYETCSSIEMPDLFMLKCH